MACRTGCLTQDHKTWGECARAADIQIDKHGLQNRNAEKSKDNRLELYRDARKAGVQPRTTKLKDVREALETGGVRQ